MGGSTPPSRATSPPPRRRRPPTPTHSAPSTWTCAGGKWGPRATRTPLSAPSASKRLRAATPSSRPSRAPPPLARRSRGAATWTATAWRTLWWVRPGTTARRPTRALSTSSSWTRRGPSRRATSRRASRTARLPTTATSRGAPRASPRATSLASRWRCFRTWTQTASRRSPLPPRGACGCSTWRGIPPPRARCAHPPSLPTSSSTCRPPSPWCPRPWRCGSTPRGTGCWTSSSATRGPPTAPSTSWA
mmetsp:Transcript_7454/g.19102  ORF Transcript_7454/g.19102 Transcript_7454/m.19102 type:complete len:247 (-) Transcript_7454:122-862(-)